MKLLLVHTTKNCLFIFNVLLWHGNWVFKDNLLIPLLWPSLTNTFFSMVHMRFNNYLNFFVIEKCFVSYPSSSLIETIGWSQVTPNVLDSLGIWIQNVGKVHQEFFETVEGIYAYEITTSKKESLLKLDTFIITELFLSFLLFIVKTKSWFRFNIFFKLGMVDCLEQSWSLSTKSSGSRGIARIWKKYRKTSWMCSHSHPR